MQEMSEAGSNELTILNYLNEDCWKDVLDYLPVRDVIRSERVSHGWQMVVLAYLRRIPIGVEHHLHPQCERHSKIRKIKLKLTKWSSFGTWTNKLGPSVVDTYCASEDSLKTVGENCPNLETIMFYGLHNPFLLTSQYENFKWLQRISFNMCHSISDSCISQLPANNVLEELEFHNNDQVTGRFLTNTKLKNLKSLVFNRCEALNFSQLFSAVNRLSQLTKLVVKLVPMNIYSKIDLILDKMHKLEHLELYSPRDRGEMRFDWILESLFRLSSLKHLGGCIATDRDLEIVTRRCKNLRSLDLSDCEDLWGGGVATACAPGSARLEALGLQRCDLADGDVLDIVRACPNLTRLDVRFCSKLTRACLPRVAAARREMRVRRALHLYIDDTDELKSGPPGDPFMGRYEGLIIHH